jgi:hypothetical protein
MEQTTTTAATASTSSSTPATTLGDAAAALALADATSAATPQTTETSPATTPAAATAQPGDAQVPAAEPSTDLKGEPPKWRWQDILANARETTAAETEARIRQEFEGLKDFQGLSAQERAGLVTWQRALSGDPAAMAHVSTVARTNPQVAQLLKGLIPDAPAAPASDPEPEPDLQAADQTLVYSAPQLKKWQQWNTRRLTNELRQEFKKEMQPLQTVAQTFHQKEAQAGYTTAVSSVVASLKQADPDFNEKVHGPQMWALINGDPQLQALALDPQTAGLALRHAWNEVYRSKVLPAKQQQSKAEVLTDIQQRAVQATINPATASTATPKTTLGDARAALEHAYAVTGS